MTVEQVLRAVAEMPRDDWMRIQCGLAEMISAQFTSAEKADILHALAETEAEFERGEGLDEQAARRRLGLA